MTKRGIQPLNYQSYAHNTVTTVEGAVIEEALTCIHVNGQELATFMCTPTQLESLALGFLRSEGFIQSIAEIELLTLSANESCVDVWLKEGVPFNRPTRHIVTSGCGGGITFDDLSQQYPPVEHPRRLSPTQVTSLMKMLHQAAELYNEVRGVHTSALSDGERLLFVAQDVGRHNTIDRLWGQALQANIDPAGLILLASGRISSEMLRKAVKMGIPMVISRTSPTSLSVQLGQAWHIGLIGYARGSSFRVYTGAERISE